MRPEKLTLSLDPPEHARNTVAGTLMTTAYLGERRQYFVKIDGKAEPVAVSMQNSQRHMPQGLEQGRAVWMSWRDDAYVVLDHD